MTFTNDVDVPALFANSLRAGDGKRVKMDLPYWSAVVFRRASGDTGLLIILAKWKLTGRSYAAG